MSDAPKTIWAFMPDIFDNMSVWQDEPSPAGDTIKYTRTDSIPSPDALIRAALEAAAERAWQKGCPLDTAKAIRAIANDPEAIAAIRKAAEGRG